MLIRSQDVRSPRRVVVRLWLILCLLSALSNTTKGQQVISLCRDSNVTYTYYAFTNTYGVWSWQVNGEHVSDIYQFTYTFDSVGTYHIYGVFTNGCSAADVDYVVNVLECLQNAIYFPNTFTPNGDGLNDYWRPEGIGVDDIRWYIFDRWGLQIYAAHGKDDRWDGAMWHDGTRRPCQSDVYVWLAQWNYYNGGWNSKTGRVTIAR